MPNSNANVSAEPNSLAAISDVVFRVLCSLIFIVGGLGHFFRSDEMLQRIRQSPWLRVVEMFGDPLLHLWISGAVLLVGGLFLAFGWRTRLAATALLMVIIPITIAIHVAPGHEGPFLKNVAIAGALIHFIFRGPGHFSLDSR